MNRGGVGCDPQVAVCCWLAVQTVQMYLGESLSAVAVLVDELVLAVELEGVVVVAVVLVLQWVEGQLA